MKKCQRCGELYYDLETHKCKVPQQSEGLANPDPAIPFYQMPDQPSNDNQQDKSFDGFGGGDFGGGGASGSYDSSSSDSSSSDSGSSDCGGGDSGGGGGD